jgi:hypothetical protein
MSSANNNNDKFITEPTDAPPEKRKNKKNKKTPEELERRKNMTPAEMQAETRRKAIKKEAKRLVYAQRAELLAAAQQESADTNSLVPPVSPAVEMSATMSDANNCPTQYVSPMSSPVNSALAGR